MEDVQDLLSLKGEKEHHRSQGTARTNPLFKNSTNTIGKTEFKHLLKLSRLIKTKQNQRMAASWPFFLLQRCLWEQVCVPFLISYKKADRSIIKRRGMMRGMKSGAHLSVEGPCDGLEDPICTVHAPNLTFCHYTRQSWETKEAHEIR